jgi:hypothetical protein
MRYNGCVQGPQTINDSYYCLRSKPDGKISILTTNSYVVGEYDDKTGDIRWQRVVLANQKVVIQGYLNRHYPVKGETTTTTTTPKDTRKKPVAA